MDEDDYLQGQTTVPITATQAVAQATVSRHLEHTLAQWIKFEKDPNALMP